MRKCILVKKNMEGSSPAFRAELRAEADFLPTVSKGKREFFNRQPENVFTVTLDVDSTVASPNWLSRKQKAQTRTAIIWSRGWCSYCPPVHLLRKEEKLLEYKVFEKEKFLPNVMGQAIWAESILL
ncbi:uncharacterized protein LOC110598844 [Ictidomys tridecemlineatus]